MCSNLTPKLRATCSRSAWLLTIIGMSAAHSPDCQRESRSYRQWLYFDTKIASRSLLATRSSRQFMLQGTATSAREVPLEPLDHVRAGRRGPLDAHEEDAALGIHVLVEVDDVAVDLADQRGNGSDQALAIWTVDQQYQIRGHRKTAAVGQESSLAVSLQERSPGHRVVYRPRPAGRQAELAGSAFSSASSISTGWGAPM